MSLLFQRIYGIQAKVTNVVPAANEFVLYKVFDLSAMRECYWWVFQELIIGANESVYDYACAASFNCCDTLEEAFNRRDHRNSFADLKDAEEWLQKDLQGTIWEPTLHG